MSSQSIISRSCLLAGAIRQPIHCRWFTSANHLDLIKKLRERTGAGISDCKKAIESENGDLEKALDWLRKKGVAAATKKTGRVASEGLVGISILSSKSAAVVVEVNSETDFVSRNSKFQELVDHVARTALASSSSSPGDIPAETLKNAIVVDSDNQRNVGSLITDAVGTIGENIQLRRAHALAASPDASYSSVAAYVHLPSSPTLGRMASLVSLAVENAPSPLSSEQKAAADKLALNLAMHICASRPLFLARENVTAEALQRERDVLTEQARQTGKPEHLISRMVDGKIAKFYEDTVLMEQPYVLADAGQKVSKSLEEAAKTIGGAGSKVRVVDFVRFGVGEGVPKEEPASA